MPGVFMLRSFLRGWSNLVVFLGGRPLILILCLDIILLMLLKVGPTKGKKATDVGSSLGVPSPPGGLRAHQNLVSLYPFCLNILQRNSSYPGRLSWSQMTLPQCTKADGMEWLLAGWWCDSVFRYRLCGQATCMPCVPKSHLVFSICQGSGREGGHSSQSPPWTVCWDECCWGS